MGLKARARRLSLLTPQRDRHCQYPARGAVPARSNVYVSLMAYQKVDTTLKVDNCETQAPYVLVRRPLITLALKRLKGDVQRTIHITSTSLLTLPVLCGPYARKPSLANTHQQNPFRLQHSARNGARPLSDLNSTHHNFPATCQRGRPAMGVSRGRGMHCLISDPGQSRKTTSLVLQYTNLQRMLSWVHSDSKMDTKAGWTAQSQPDG